MAAELAVTTTGIVLSPLLQVLFDRMASREFDDFFWRLKPCKSLLWKLKTALLSCNAVLEDAEDKQVMKTSVKDWLDELKDVVYDAEEILDEIATEVLQRKLDPNSKTIYSTVRDSISSFLFEIKTIEGKIKDAIGKLDKLEKQISVLGLISGVRGQPLERESMTLLIEKSQIYGRDNEKKDIIDSLCSDDASGSEIGVIAIVGMAGIGKTILANLVYNEVERFDSKAWVCVSNPLDVCKVMKTIIEAINPSNCDIEDMRQLEIKLKGTLENKKFLIVLDDVWDKNYVKWEILSNAFKSGAQGSKVIVTTQDSEVARVMHAGAIHLIRELPKEDSWSLFAKYAFKDGNSNAYPQLEEIGGQIVKKCKGLPLAIKAIGYLLWSNLDVNEWDKVLRSELWDSPIKETNILPALLLSYKYLSLDLKRCFAYCSIFPKGYAFTKNTLVLLWMAEGLLPKPTNKAMEEVGDDYFLALESRSLFQQSNSEQYIIHDLVSDLAKFISKQFTLSHEDEYSCEIGIKTRHFSYDSSNFPDKKFETFNKDMRLRTILKLDVGRSRGKLEIPMIRCLRVLILRHYEDLSELLDSIGKFKLLRYLDFSHALIERLPDSLCELCNLQTLKLSYCTRLTALPRDMHKLINLRHLDITRTEIREMPINLGELKCLQTLSTFIVSKHNGSGIEELGKLTNLRRSLNVIELQNVESSIDAKGANLKDKKYIENLGLRWKVETTASECHKVVLDSLKPHSTLKTLVIIGYGDTSFPKWVGDASFFNITSLDLVNCKFCCSLPPLGQLPSLQHLRIVGLDGVVKVGCEFYGIGSSSMKPFGALKFLKFFDMIGWEEWLSFEGEAFSKLEKLEIAWCPKVTGGLPAHLPSLAELLIRKCPRLVVSLPRASSQCSLELSDCNTVLLNESLTGIHYSQVYLLTVSFKSFPLFSKLRKLEIKDCGDLESLTVGEQHDLLLSEIEIHRCPNFAYFPQGGLRAPNLTKFKIENCRSLRSLPENMHMLHSLEELHIKDCPQVESFPEGGLPPNLNEIRLLDCDKLFASRMGWSLQNLLCVRRFTIHDYKSEDVESFPEEGLLPASLTRLCIEGFPNLKSLDKKGLLHITALEQLSIGCCPNFERMPKDGLPASLSSLSIFCCPLLEKALKREEGEERRKIAHVPKIYINGRRLMG